MRSMILTAVAVASMLSVSGCGLSGACVSTGSSTGIEQCMQDWDRSDCDSFASNRVNSATWTFYPAQTCADRGFSKYCSDSTYSYCH